MKKILFMFFLFLSMSACVPVTQIVPTKAPTVLPTVIPTNTAQAEKTCPSGNFDIEVPDLTTMIKLDNGSYMFRNPLEVSQEVVDALNQGGVEKLISSYSAEYPQKYFRTFDITGNGLLEIFLRIERQNFGYRCVDGVYEEFFDIYHIDLPPSILFLGDVNKNGQQDIVIDTFDDWNRTAVSMYEWNGEEFQDLVHEDTYYHDRVEVGGAGHTSIVDVDGDDIYELIISEIKPTDLGTIGGFHGHWREETIIYAWDGTYYSEYLREYATPEFRYEAVQDGDDKFNHYQDYDAALSFYELAITDETLASWNADEWWHLANHDNNGLSQPDPQQISYNEKEFQQLTTYARYRIMLVYILQGKLEEAESMYKELLDYVKDSPDGRPYADVATIFLDEYLESSKIEKACSLVSNYAETRPEILYPLSSNDELETVLFWNKEYSPEDICIQTEELEVKE